MSLSQRLNLHETPLFLIDGTSFLYRAFYAYPDLKRSDGFPTNALFNVMRLLLRILREEQPLFAGFFLDGPGPTFRHERFPAYKAQRLKAPEDLLRQITPLRQGVELLGLTVQVSEGVEADDLIASASARFKAERPVVIVASDKDLMQCLDSGVYIWDPGLKSEKLVSLESFGREHDLAPSQWPDYQALVGDSSDNIPGIPGVGPKTAGALMQRFPSLEDLRDGAARLSPKEKQKILPTLDQVFLYRELTRLRTDLLSTADLSEFRCRTVSIEALRNFLQEYEFRSLIRDMPGAFGQKAPRSLDGAASPDPKPQSDSRPQPLRDLPDLAGKKAAVWPETGQWRLAFDDTEHVWPRSPDMDPDAAGRAMAAAMRSAVRVAAHSWKDLLHSCPLWADVDMRHRFDVGLAAYLLQPAERDYGLASLVRVFGHELSGLPVGPDRSAPALFILRLSELLERRVDQTGLAGLMQTLEVPLIPVLTDMEQAGVALDGTALNAFLEDVRADLERIEQSVYSLAGGHFNLRSSQQLAEVLFDRLGLKPGRKTPGGSRSTNSEILEKLAANHPIVQEILEYRKLEKLRSTYLEPLPRLADASGRLHTTFNQLATATGRLSSSNPNLQNIPIRGSLGRRMRACFIAAKGCDLVSADYSQIELRILAHLSEDPHLLDLFAQGTDVHAGTAAILFAKAPERVTADERRKAKTINFGLLYGMGPQKLGRELGISLREAKDFIQLYFSRLAKVREFYEQVVDRVKHDGAVFTLSGRRRLLPDIHSRNENLAQTARRVAINTVVQGSAADVIKMAMLRVHQDEALKKLQARMILQVHDELLLEAPRTAAKKVGQRVAELMSTVMSLKVSLAVDWGVGSNWAEAHE